MIPNHDYTWFMFEHLLPDMCFGEKCGEGLVMKALAGANLRLWSLFYSDLPTTFVGSQIARFSNSVGFAVLR